MSGIRLYYCESLGAKIPARMCKTNQARAQKAKGRGLKSGAFGRDWWAAFDSIKLGACLDCVGVVRLARVPGAPKPTIYRRTRPAPQPVAEEAAGDAAEGAVEQGGEGGGAMGADHSFDLAAMFGDQGQEHAPGRRAPPPISLEADS